MSLEYSEPEALRGQIVTVENDLLSQYFPAQDVIVARRWAGLPLASVGLASLDVSALRAEVQRGAVTARVLEETSPLMPSDLSTGLDVGAALAGIPTGPADPLAGSYVIEVVDPESSDVTEALWVDRRTYFLEKVVHYVDGRRARVIEVDSLHVDQGLTPDDLLTLPRGATTIRG
jgi:hypothetical protein